MTTLKPPVASRRWAGPALVLVAVLALIAVLYWRFRPAPAELVGGGIVSPPFDAPDFTLTDQFDHSQRLQDFRGRPVALTFVYTNCPDACPLIASNMRVAYTKLGDEAKSVVLLAVTVDPERDTIPQVRRFSQQRGLMDEWFFLTGSRSELEQVWKLYGIYAQYVDSRGSPIAPPAADPNQASPSTLEHSAPVFLVDKRGKVRALLPTDFTAADLATDLHRLLAEA
jgi:protein SCO1/2